VVAVDQVMEINHQVLVLMVDLVAVVVWVTKPELVVE
tara:strand:- start:476 stop:586 length:111 start_codon:yes stop_codon:yes gene_type:complete